MKKSSYKQTCLRATDVTMLPELAHFEVPGASVTLHQGERFFAITRVKVQYDHCTDTVDSVYTAATRAGIDQCFESFRRWTATYSAPQEEPQP